MLSPTVSDALTIDLEQALSKARDLSTAASESNRGSALTSTKKSHFVPLFNHYVRKTKKLSEIEKMSAAQVRYQILMKLVEFLKNDKNGSSYGFERVSQEENDILLRMIVRAQLKQNDLLQMIQEYLSRELPEVKDLYDEPLQERYVDGKKVLSALYYVQSRIEEIESGRWDLSTLPDELREKYSGKKFSCFYSWYKDKEKLEMYKKETIQEHHALLNRLQKTSKSKQVSNDDSDFHSMAKKTLLGYDSKTKFDNKVSSENGSDTGESISYKSNGDDGRLPESELNALLLGGWSQRLIVARCYQFTTVQRWEATLRTIYDSDQAKDIGL